MELPDILAGPILRRTNPDSVYIWLATSRPFHIEAKLFTIEGSKESHTCSHFLLTDRSNTKSIQFGQQLFIHLIQVMPAADPFPVNTLLGYNLFLSNGESKKDLADYGMLSPESPYSIVYDNLKYPSFFISRQKSSNILYGSCRKLHGKGGDALTAADFRIEKVYDQLDKRPHSLFLLGDQIYADDVADPLLPPLIKLSRQLMGKDEELSLLDERLNQEPFCRSLFQARGRTFIMEHFCQFTSSHAENHLIQFGEYAALYLLSFSPQLWEFIQLQNGFRTFKEEDEEGNIYFAFRDEEHTLEEFFREYDSNKVRFKEQWNEICSSARSLRRISRLLANTPSYMIFDDHDITDDWNLSSEWKESVRQSALGEHVVANGLSAYWAFQGWGNHPEGFNHDFIEKMKSYFRDMDAASNEHKEWTASMWEYDSWHFVTPTEPKALFLDTRTQRTYDMMPKPVKIGWMVSETKHSPQLVSRDAFKRASHSLHESGWQSGQPLIIASPAPFYGIGVIESILDSYVYPLRTAGIPVHQVMDHEAWKYNGKGFSEFLHWIFTWNPSRCFIVSGDVHYASSVSSNVQARDGNQASIVQFTSSPINNKSFTGIWGMLMKAIALFNSSKRKKESITRYCSSDYMILNQPSPSSYPSNAHWQETLHYLKTEKGRLLATDNNIGLLSLSGEQAENRLLFYDGWFNSETRFQSISFKQKNHHGE